MFTSIRPKLLFFVLTLILVTLLPVVIISSSLITRAVREMHHENVVQQVNTIEQLLVVLYDDLDSNIKMFAESALVRDSDNTITNYLNYDGTAVMTPSKNGGIEEQIYKGFENYANTHPGTLYVYMGTKDGGYIQWPETKNSRNYDPRKRPWYELAVASPGRIIRTEPYLDSTNNVTIVSNARSFSSPDGQLYGSMAIDVSNDKLSGIMNGIKIGKSGYVIMLHKSGLVLADPRHSENNGKQVKEIELAGSEKLLSGKSSSFETVIDGVEFQVDSFPSAKTDWIIAVLIETNELTATAGSIRNTILMVTAAILLAVGLVTFFVSNRFVQPIKKMVQDLMESEGDLTMRLEVRSRDEIGELASWFNIFLERLQKMIGGISDNTNDVDTSARDLTEIAAALKSNARGTAEQANTVAAAAEEMNVNINNVAAAMEESTTNTTMVAGAAEEMNATVNEIAGNVQAAAEISAAGVEQAQATSAKMGELDEAAKAISKVTEAITDISEQTNLLALNATIEAARAGEAGKGFAVVANEIKELAKQTAEATGDIREKIAGVQHTSSVSIASIEEIVTLINDINSTISVVATAVEQQTLATREIADGIGQASLGLGEVNENVNQSSTVSSSISEEIAGVNGASNEIAERSETLAGEAENLQNLAQNLKVLVGNFSI